MAKPPTEAGPWPSDATVHRIHDRYLLEIVEDMGVCPFARHSREQNRVHRPLFRFDGPADPQAPAQTLAALVRERSDAEIVLLTFVVGSDHAFARPEPFEDFLKQVREAYAELSDERFYMVAFHRDLGQRFVGAGAHDVTRDGLVPVLRRTPDPVIQCVRASVLDEARRQAQGMMAARMERDMPDMSPEIRALIHSSVSADSELSADIAQRNYDSVGRGAGWERLLETIEDILRDRDRAYARDAGVDPT